MSSIDIPDVGFVLILEPNFEFPILIEYPISKNSAIAGIMNPTATAMYNTSFVNTFTRKLWIGGKITMIKLVKREENIKSPKNCHL